MTKMTAVRKQQEASDHNDIDMFAQAMHSVVTFLFMPLTI